MNIMAEPRAVDGENIFVYTGGEQIVPDDVTHVIVDKSVVRKQQEDAKFQRGPS